MWRRAELKYWIEGGGAGVGGAGVRGAGAAGSREAGGRKKPVFVECCITAAISDTMSRRQLMPTDVDGGLVVVGSAARERMDRRTGLIRGTQASEKGTE